MAFSKLQTTAGVVISGLGLVAAVALGSVWTAMAVVDGNQAATAGRFLVAIATGLFYLVLLRAARHTAR